MSQILIRKDEETGKIEVFTDFIDSAEYVGMLDNAKARMNCPWMDAVHECSDLSKEVK